MTGLEITITYCVFLRIIWNLRMLYSYEASPTKSPFLAIGSIHFPDRAVTVLLEEIFEEEVIK